MRFRVALLPSTFHCPSSFLPRCCSRASPALPSFNILRDSHTTAWDAAAQFKALQARRLARARALARLQQQQSLRQSGPRAAGREAVLPALATSSSQSSAEMPLGPAPLQAVGSFFVPPSSPPFGRTQFQPRHDGDVGGSAGSPVPPPLLGVDALVPGVDLDNTSPRPDGMTLPPLRAVMSPASMSMSSPAATLVALSTSAPAPGTQPSQLPGDDGDLHMSDAAHGGGLSGSASTANAATDSGAGGSTAPGGSTDEDAAVLVDTEDDEEWLLSEGAARAAAAASTAPTSVLAATAPSGPSREETDSAARPTRCRSDALAFLFELTAIAKTLQLPNKNAYFRTLLDVGAPFYALFEPVLGDRHATVREVSMALDIVHAFVMFDAASLRDYCVKQRRHPPSPPDSVAAASRHSVSAAAAEAIAAAEAAAGAAPAAVPFVDDGASIRLYEKLAANNLLPPESAPAAAALLTSYNEVHRAGGEHGLLVHGVDRFASLLHRLVWRAVDDPEPSIQSSACDVLRVLLEVDGPLTATAEPDSFVYGFYDHYLAWLVTPFLHPSLPALPEPAAPSATMRMLDTLLSAHGSLEKVPSQTLKDQVVQRLAAGFDGSVGRETPQSKASKAAIAELVCFCVQHHAYRMKYFALRANLVPRMLRLLRYREKHMVLLAVRLLRTIIGVKDEFYNRALVKAEVFAPLVAAFLANGLRYNLVDSAILDVFEFVRTNDVRILVDHVGKAYAPLARAVTYVDTFKSLMRLHSRDDSGAPAPSSGTAGVGSGIVRTGAGFARAASGGSGIVIMNGSRVLDDDDDDVDGEAEERYFSQDDDDSGDGDAADDDDVTAGTSLVVGIGRGGNGARIGVPDTAAGIANAANALWGGTSRPSGTGGARAGSPANASTLPNGDPLRRSLVLTATASSAAAGSGANSTNAASAAGPHRGAQNRRTPVVAPGGGARAAGRSLASAGGQDEFEFDEPTAPASPTSPAGAAGVAASPPSTVSSGAAGDGSVPPGAPSPPGVAAPAATAFADAAAATAPPATQSAGEGSSDQAGEFLDRSDFLRRSGSGTGDEDDVGGFLARLGSTRGVAPAAASPLRTAAAAPQPPVPSVLPAAAASKSGSASAGGGISFKLSARSRVGGAAQLSAAAALLSTGSSGGSGAGSAGTGGGSGAAAAGSPERSNSQVGAAGDGSTGRAAHEGETTASSHGASLVDYPADEAEADGAPHDAATGAALLAGTDVLGRKRSLADVDAPGVADASNQPQEHNSGHSHGHGDAAAAPDAADSSVATAAVAATSSFPSTGRTLAAKSDAGVGGDPDSASGLHDQPCVPLRKRSRVEAADGEFE